MLEFPLLSDVDKQISLSYGVGIEEGETGEKGNRNEKQSFITFANKISFYLHLRKALLTDQHSLLIITRFYVT